MEPSRPPTAQEESGRIQQLLDEIRELATAPAWERVEELVQRLMGLQAEGLSRLLSHARAGAAGFDERIAGDDLVSSLLLLHGLHPRPARERILRALEELRPQLAARGARAELVDLDGEAVRIRVLGSAPADAIRRAVEDAAPELIRVVVEDAGALVSLRIPGAAA